MALLKNSATSWHKQILKDLTKLPGKGTDQEKAWVQKYLGSNKPTRCIKTSAIVKLASQISKKILPSEIISVVNSLYTQATTFEEMHLAGAILNRNPKIKTRGCQATKLLVKLYPRLGRNRYLVPKRLEHRSNLN